MKIPIIFSFLVLPLLSISQSQGFSYSYFNSSYSIARTAIQTSDNGYAVIINESSRIIGKTNQVTVIRLNRNGQFISSNSINNDSISFNITKLLKTKFGFLGIGGALNTVSRKNFLWLTKFDSAFNLISDRFHETPNTVQVANVDTDRDSNFIIGSFMFYKDYSPRLFGAKINKEGNLTYLTYKYPTDTTWAAINLSPYMGFFDCFQAMKDSARYVLFDGNRVIDVDTSFNIIHTAYIYGPNGSDLLGLQPTAKRVNDSTYFMAGRYRTNLFFFKTNLKGEHLVFKQLGNSDTLQKQAYYNSIDTTKNGDIFIGGVFNGTLPSGFSFVYDTSQFVLYKLDKSHNTIWSRKYGKDNVYDMDGILATNDGGCLMYGLRYNYNSERTTEAYILKVDGNGLITSETSIPLSITTVQLSPNPSSGLVQTNLSKDAGETDLKFFDLTGRLLKVVHLAVPNQIFDVSDLPIGQYVFHVFDKSKHPLSIGKFVKF